VGVDIGCGMCAVKTSLTSLDMNSIKKIMQEIRQSVPLGFKHHKNRQNQILMPAGSDELLIVKSEYESARTQIGTLGGGNHFIEIQQGDDGHIWLMVHSGSRNIGYRVAGYYNRLAIELNKRWKSPVPPNWQLAYLPVETEEGQRYLDEMRYCVEFALANRKLMMERMQTAVLHNVAAVSFEPLINIAHNYAALEHHFGREVMVHRKGATSARKGEYGIIPGSQGTASYIVMGKGNPESFASCSHGAGRIMGRKEAQRQLRLEVEKKRLDDLGILHAVRSKKDLDEAAGAYKDIQQVIANQMDLIEVKVKLKPLAVIKG
jgi:tRNA-splicing ligase RtcB